VATPGKGVGRAGTAVAQWLEKELDPEKEQDPVTRLDPAKGLDPSYRTRGGHGHRGVLPMLPKPQHVRKSATVEVDQLEEAEWEGNQWPVERGASIQKGDCSEG
jgi:hypothetical protein